MVHLVLAKTVPIISVIMKTDPKFKILAYKAKRGVFSPKELERTPVRMLGNVLACWKGVERVKKNLTSGSLQNNTHTHTHEYTPRSKEGRRGQRRWRSYQ